MVGRKHAEKPKKRRRDKDKPKPQFRGRKRQGAVGRAVTPPPALLPAFYWAVRARPKTGRKGGGGRRARWKDLAYIYEWDSQHGTVEKYDSVGRHLGEFDPLTGAQLKPPRANRKVEP